VGDRKSPFSITLSNGLYNSLYYRTSRDRSTSRLQTRRHGVQLPARSSASIPRGTVPTSHKCRITATSPIRHPTASSRTAPPTQLLWLTGFQCGWSVGLEFPAGQLAESDYWREQFQTISEDIFIRNVLMHLAR